MAMHLRKDEEQLEELGRRKTRMIKGSKTTVPFGARLKERGLLNEERRTEGDIMFSEHIKVSCKRLNCSPCAVQIRVVVKGLNHRKGNFGEYVKRCSKETEALNCHGVCGIAVIGEL